MTNLDKVKSLPIKEFLYFLELVASGSVPYDKVCERQYDWGCGSCNFLSGCIKDWARLDYKEEDWGEWF